MVQDEEVRNILEAEALERSHEKRWLVAQTHRSQAASLAEQEENAGQTQLQQVQGTAG